MNIKIPYLIHFTICVFCIVTLPQLSKGQNAPIEYVKNAGQWNGPFEYKGVTPRGDFYLRKNGFMVVLAHKDNHQKTHEKKHGQIKGPVILNYHAYEMNFLGANENPLMTPSKLQPHYYNYFLGSDKSRWKSNIYPAQNVDYQNLYNKIDAHLYSENGNIKYDFILHPGADINQIKVAYNGVSSIQLRRGVIEVGTSVGDNVEQTPYAYQMIDGNRVEVKCTYTLKDKTVGYKITSNNYNPQYDLVIDPVIVFCSFTGSTADNWGYTATYDNAGNFYAGGIVGSASGLLGTGSYPTIGAFQATYGGGGAGGMGNLFRYDGTISKFNSSGNALIYSSYLGGSDNDQPHSLVVNSNNELVIAGRTYSNNFPTSTGCFDNTFNGNADAFVTVISAAGNTIVGSTYIGGSGDDCVNLYADENTIADLKHNYGDDARSEVIVDSSNNIFVIAASSSTNFPIVNGHQTIKSGLQDAVAFALNANCSTQLWGTYIGGTNNDAGYVLCFNKHNQSELYLAGGTMSSNFPATAGSLNPTYKGGTMDGWLMRINNLATGTKTVNACTFIGTNSYDQVYGVQTDDYNKVFVMGQTMGAYPVVGAVYSNPNSSQFVSKIDNSLAGPLIVSNVFGKGSTLETDISPNAFLVDICGNVSISGWGGDIGVIGNVGNTTGLPITTNALQPTTDSKDFYFIVFGPNLATLNYASFFGQVGGTCEHVDGGTSRFDPQGIIYQAICANCGSAASATFPTTAGAWTTINPSPNCNLAALKIDFQQIGASAVSSASPSATGCAPLTVNFANASTNATSYLWIFGDGTPNSTATTPTHIYNTPGTFICTLVAYNPNGCFGTSDTSLLNITVKSDSLHPSFVAVKIDSCDPFSVFVLSTSTYNTGPLPASTTYLWNFGDGTTSTLANPPIHAYAVTGSYLITLTLTDTNACNNPATASHIVNYTNNVIDATFPLPDTVCPPYTHTFVPITTNATTYLWNFGDGSATSNLQSPTHTYPTPGTYIVTLIITNPNSCNLIDTFTQIINVQPKVTASFTYAKVDTCDPYIISLNNTSIINTGNPNAVFTWSFGDGTTFIGLNPGTHSYAAPGTYTITFTITDPMACNSPQTFSAPVTFIDNNVRALFEMPDTVCLPFTHIFVNTSVNVATYAWNFGDGNTSTSAVPTNTYTVPGTYTVTLYAYNPLTCNKVDSAKQTFYGAPSPIANFYYQPNPPQPNKQVEFTNTSSGATHYLWDFGDGQGSTLVNPKHLYNVSGDFTVCLTAYNEFNCPDTACQPITALVTNIVDVPTGFTPNGDGTNDIILVRGYGIHTMLFRIYNRWGELVFETTNKEKGWDGKYKGVLQEMDAFAYILDVTFTDNSKILKKGNITLIH
jgi:gliding motility-associated-like protein